MILVSIIIPNYNHSQFLSNRIETVLNQTYSNFEVIILDDDSADDSKEIIERYKHHPKVSQIIYNKQNSGSPFKQWKKGIELAKGEWIWIAESDDYAATTFLEKAVEAIEQYPTLGMFYCDSYIAEPWNSTPVEKFSTRKNEFFKVTKWNCTYFKNGSEELNEYLKLICTINNASSLVFRKKQAIRILPQLEKFIFHGDWYFYIRMSLTGDILYLNQPLNYYVSNDKGHLNSRLDLARSKAEHFEILNFLYFCDHLTGKKRPCYLLFFQIFKFQFFRRQIKDHIQHWKKLLETQ